MRQLLESWQTCFLAASTLGSELRQAMAALPGLAKWRYDLHRERVIASGRRVYPDVTLREFQINSTVGMLNQRDQVA